MACNHDFGRNKVSVYKWNMNCGHAWLAFVHNFQQYQKIATKPQLKQQFKTLFIIKQPFIQPIQKTFKHDQKI